MRNREKVSEHVKAERKCSERGGGAKRKWRIKEKAMQKKDDNDKKAILNIKIKINWLIILESVLVKNQTKLKHVKRKKRIRKQMTSRE